MQNNKLGCFTGAGIFATLLTLFVIVGVAFASGSQMFSAGDLNAELGQSYGGVNSHAQITECKACHTAPWEIEKMADRCAACHTDIAAQMFDVAKLHGAIMQKSLALSCRDCHPEHRGESASLTEMGENTFPHDAMGYSLNGHQITPAGVAFTCKDCHHEDVTTFAPELCDSCHRQIDIAFTEAHTLAFGTDCLACHDGVDRYGDDFSHAAFGFSLDGKHANLDCAQCHVSARNVSDLQSAPTDCFSCHQKDDAHAGAYGTECGVCHSPEAWTPARFDHNLTSFKLEGEHVNTACEKCHVNNVFKGTPSDCYSCHQKDDKHNGQFGTACETCHNPSSWTNATFDHNLSAFKLEGKHINVACEKCHVNSVFKGTPADCYSCHQKDDEHNGQFGTDCSTCHTPNNWDDATFDHSLSAFKLEGKHADVKCENCHLNNVFKGTPQDCYSCHKQDDEHNGQFGTDCSACHTPKSWGDATFDHSRSAFKLEGAHTQVRCEQCHKNNVFKGTPLACSSCHADPAFHAGVFGADCASCHNTSNWNQARFNLSHPEPRVEEGGSGINHGGATCRQCHPSTVQQASCTACHDSNNPEGGGGGND